MTLDDYRALLAEYEAFELQSSVAEYTDTGRAWELLTRMALAVEHALATLKQVEVKPLIRQYYVTSVDDFGTVYAEPMNLDQVWDEDSVAALAHTFEDDIYFYVDVVQP